MSNYIIVVSFIIPLQLYLYSMPEKFPDLIKYKHRFKDELIYSHQPST